MAEFEFSLPGEIRFIVGPLCGYSGSMKAACAVRVGSSVQGLSFRHRSALRFRGLGLRL